MFKKYYRLTYEPYLLITVYPVHVEIKKKKNKTIILFFFPSFSVYLLISIFDGSLDRARTMHITFNAISYKIYLFMLSLSYLEQQVKNR